MKPKPPSTEQPAGCDGTDGGAEAVGSGALTAGHHATFGAGSITGDMDGMSDALGSAGSAVSGS